MLLKLHQISIILIMVIVLLLNNFTRALTMTKLRWQTICRGSVRSSYPFHIYAYLSFGLPDGTEFDDDRMANTFQDFESNSYDSGLQALRAYHKIHGDLVIPRSFTVPNSKEYPVEWHGAKLARHIYNMKWWQQHIASNSERVSQLNEIDFIWGRLQPQWNIFMEGMSHYYRLNGDSRVPTSFVIPNNDPWPKACWGFPLGNVAYRVRSRNDLLSGYDVVNRRAQLNEMEFIWDFSEHNFMKFFMALKHYSRMEQTTNISKSPSSSRERTIRVPYKFVVPAGHEHGWPDDLWGYPLGAKCMAVRQKDLYIKNNPARKSKLEDIGFRFSGNASAGWLDVVHAAAIYSRMHGRTLDVPSNFIVPAPPEGNLLHTQDAWPWPDHLSGLKLGQRLKDVRLKGTYLMGRDKHIRKAQLDALGFVWNPKRGRRKRGLGDTASKDSTD